MQTSELEAWTADGFSNGWEMPTAPLWKRLPMIRHVRCIVLSFRVSAHEAFWSNFALISGYDRWVLWGIWHGLERPADAMLAAREAGDE